MSFYRDLAPGQNAHVNYEPSLHEGLREASPAPTNPPEIRGRLTRSVIERRNDYVQAAVVTTLMMDWERDGLVRNIGDALSQCQPDVQLRIVVASVSGAR